MTRKFRWAALAACCLVAVASNVASAHRSELASPLRLATIQMIGANIGWATAGNTVFHTTDGGSFWEDVMPASAAHAPEIATFFLSGSTAWIAISVGLYEESNRVTVYRTVDAGFHWQVFALRQHGGVVWGQRLDFADPRNGWLLLSRGVGMGQNPYILVHSRDGGAHWFTVARSDPPSSRVFPGCNCTQAITFRTPFAGFSTGTQFAYPYKDWLYLTRDSGHTWTRLGLSIPRGYIATETEAPTFFGHGNGVLLAKLSTSSSKSLFETYVTHDGGLSWKGTSAVKPHAVGGLSQSFVDQRHGWVTDGTRLYRTLDSGTHWSAFDPRVPIFARGFWPNGVPTGTTIDFVSRTTGFALNPQVTAHQRPYILETTDAGRTWQAVYTLSARWMVVR